jgi:lipopolysaccharide export system protein LptA
MSLRRVLVCLLVPGLMSHAAAADAPAPAPASPAATAAPAVPLVPTVIESGAAEMVSTEKETTFTFSKGVKVTATNMILTCDDLVVIAKRSGDPTATLGKQENFKSLIATGNVRILQNDREATCGRAAVYPGDDKVELTENPVVRSTKEGWVQTGPKMILHRGERRAVIESTATQRPQLTLPPLKDLGYDKEKPKAKAKAGEKKDAEASSTPSPAPTPNPPPLTVPGISPQPK